MRRLGNMNIRLAVSLELGLDGKHEGYIAARLAALLTGEADLVKQTRSLFEETLEHVTAARIAKLEANAGDVVVVNVPNRSSAESQYLAMKAVGDALQKQGKTCIVVGLREGFEPRKLAPLERAKWILTMGGMPPELTPEMVMPDCDCPIVDGTVQHWQLCPEFPNRDFDTLEIACFASRMCPSCAGRGYYVRHTGQGGKGQRLMGACGCASDAWQKRAREVEANLAKRLEAAGVVHAEEQEQAAPNP